MIDFLRKIFGLSSGKPASKPEKGGVSPVPGQMPVILQADEHRIDPRLVSKNAIRVVTILQQAGYAAFIVGGAVRDLMLGEKPKDFDVATDATPEQVRRLFRRAFLIGRRFQIVHVRMGRDDLFEVTTFRGNSQKPAEVDDSGRLLSDNTFGTQAEDAARRDFTINALYYNPTDQTLLDYHQGIHDLGTKTLRIIGDAEQRYREDPVRMLRVVRFAAKLGFTLDSATSAPIHQLCHLLDNIPPARLFDETLKLLMSGHAMSCLNELRTYDLHGRLLPLLDEALSNPKAACFIETALARTDQRINDGRTVSPGFLFAVLLWKEVESQWEAFQAKGEYPIPALVAAANAVLDRQTETLAIQRRIAADMKDIWLLQPRLERRSGKSVFRILENPHFRAAYDFLLIRCETGDLDAETGEWWKAFAAGSAEERQSLLESLSKRAADNSRSRKRRRRRKRPPSSGEGTAEAPVPGMTVPSN